MTLAGCGTMATRESQPPVAGAPDTAVVPSKSAKPRGGYYLDDGPGENPPPNLDRIPDAVPRVEPLRPATMRPYTVLGQNYTPMTQLAPYKERGSASWYGRRYHGQKTSSGEIYDMYGMTAAHTTLPIPSYARVTNLQNNKSVIVRINDRGPFHSDRVIDLSYTAAYKLGVLGGGRALVEVESVFPDAGTPTVAVAPASAAPAAPAVTAISVAEAAAPAPAPSSAGTKQAPAAAIPAVTVATEPEQKGVFLQLATFSSRDNADNYLARLRAQIDWLAPLLQIYRKDGFFRVHAGPYANPAEARSAADRIAQALGIKAMVLVR